MLRARLQHEPGMAVFLHGESPMLLYEAGRGAVCDEILKLRRAMVAKTKGSDTPAAPTRDEEAAGLAKTFCCEPTGQSMDTTSSDEDAPGSALPDHPPHAGSAGVAASSSSSNGACITCGCSVEIRPWTWERVCFCDTCVDTGCTRSHPHVYTATRL